MLAGVATLQQRQMAGLMSRYFGGNTLVIMSQREHNEIFSTQLTKLDNFRLN